ncbi:NAD(P)-dependent oxidoreductase [Nocardia pseudobrasiliensis]|uniref:3-hydroxyisobutyrate dehydrogenase-like beta-hydroxyacid dehydrogenase n=1 Tax=Nocardia pseudobrasiliensis TaxID=45979 RepID=A0A370HXD9_9NOCA|nr:NAD(P)-binding domain-containing protein [Nocardia pseudobrasiliensis]RDI63135.1 3-hydroxyisobutyrate dehydrogenase-like beta-hydroxyacid dehydrogenase [Nocardia pseudobrasiliensis]
MSEHRSVTVVGLGPMGQSMVRAFLEAGVAVTVWNRSAGKAEAMAELGATRAATLAEALDANEVIVLSLTHYDAMYDVLGPVVDRLPGKVIANLSSDSPENARKGAAWVRSHGAEFISGGFMSAGDNITHPASYLFYSGPKEVFDAHTELLRPLSPQEYLGADDGLSQVFYQALLTIFHPWMLGYQQALALIENSGSDIEQFLPYALRSNEAFPFFMTEYATGAKAGGWGDLASYRMMDAGAQHVIDAAEEVGVDATIAHAAQRVWRRGVEANREVDGSATVYELIRGIRK